MIKSFLVVTALSFLVGTAAADTKSWTALKGKLPAGTIVVGGADVTALRATPSFPKLVEWIGKEDKDTGAMLDLVKQTCGMELPAMFADFSIAVDAKEKGVVVIGLAGIDQMKLTDCITKVMTKVDAKIKLGVKVTGKLTEYTLSGQTDKIYASWLSGDVVAISMEPNGHGPLDAMMAGGAATGDLAGFLGKANTSAPGWAAFAVNDDGVKGGFGMVTLGSTLKLALKMTGITPKDGAKGRTEMTDMLKKGVDRSKKQPELTKVFKAAKVGGKDAEVTLDVAVPEASLPTLLPAFDKVF